MPKPRPSPPDEWKRLLSLGTEFLALLALWIGLGYMANKYLDLHPYGLLIGSLIGVAHVLWRLLRL